MDSRRVATDARERQQRLTKGGAEAATRGKTLRASGRRAQARADKFRAIPIKRGRRA